MHLRVSFNRLVNGKKKRRRRRTQRNAGGSHERDSRGSKIAEDLPH